MSNDDLEKRINFVYEKLIKPETSNKEKQKLLDEMRRLHYMRSPEQVALMEKAKGLR